MLCVRAPIFEKRLITLSQLTGKTKSHYVRLALQALFNEMGPIDEMNPTLSLFPFEKGPPLSLEPAIDPHLESKTGREGISL